MKPSRAFHTDILADRGPASVTEEHWRSLFYFDLYRLALGLVLVAFAASGSRLGGLGTTNPVVFLITAAAYALFGLLSLFTINAGHPDFRSQGRLQYLVDVAALTLLMHASGGPASGLGLLLVVSVAGAGVALGGRMAVFLAAVATVAVLAEYAVSHWVLGLSRGAPTQVGVLGIGLFGTAFLVHGLVVRIQRAERLAEQRGRALSKLERLNELIVEQLHTGVIATDGEGLIRAFNATALRLLGLAEPPDRHVPLAEVAPALHRRVEACARGEREDGDLEIAGRRLAPRILPLGDGSHASLIYLDDPDHLERQTQQERLAALGRLSAGLAHEIRNPLGAISHAGQLLAESPQLEGEDRRLVAIIGEHCRRVNRMVEDVLELGRRHRQQRRTLDLLPWLRRFAADLDDRGRTVLVTGPAVAADADPDQLHQILCNLVDNALRHGEGAVRIETGRDEAGRPYVEVRDEGPGVPAAQRARIFEPFYSGDSRGTGLGLYIARELCAANQAVLAYRDTGPGACFRLTLAASPPLEASA